MSNKKSSYLLNKLLLGNKKNSRLLGAWIALCLGCTLLLLSVMIWATFQDLLKGNNKEDSLGSTFLTVSKQVDNVAMANKKSTEISEEDLLHFKNAPQVQDVGLLSPASFKVAASLGTGGMSFYTLLFLEAAPDRFMDKMPEDWHWQEGDYVLPIILSRDFLNMYNYIFAPSQGLPLLSEQSVKAIGFTLTMGEGERQATYKAQVQGFSDRISSVLVPQSFIEYGNQKFATNSMQKASRMIVQVADPSSSDFVNFLKEHNYNTNSEQLRFSKMRSVVEMVSGATGLLAILLMGIGVLVFILFIELTMAKAETSVKLLLQIGYSPSQLGRFLSLKYLPIMLSALGIALLISILIQLSAANKLANIELHISPYPSMFVWLTVTVSAAILMIQIRQSIRKAINAKN